MINETLKYLLTHPEWLAKTQKELFTGDLQSIFKTAQGMEAQGYKPTFDSIKYVLDKKELFSASEQLPYIYSSKDIDESTFKVVREDLRHDALMNFVQRYEALGELDNKTFKVFGERLAALSQSDEPEPLQHAVSFFDWDKHHSPAGQIIGSGLSFLQNTGADWAKGQLIDYVAPSNNGKSTVMLHTAKHLLVTGHNVLTIVFEETQAKYMSRVGMGLLRKTKVEYERMHPEQIEREIMGRFKNLGNLDVISGSSIYVEDIKDLVKAEEEQKGYVYDCIIIDYSRQLQTRSSKKHTQTHEEISTVFRELKKYAMTKGDEKLVITATQSNRGAYGKNEVNTDNISESMGPLHNVDMMLAIKAIKTEDTDHIKEEDEVATDSSILMKISILKKREGSVNVGDYEYYALQKCANIVVAEDRNQADTIWEGLLSEQV